MSISIRKNLYSLLVIFLLVFANRSVYAQVLRFSHITGDQGLTQSTVNCITEDHQGFMWFGTQDGLNRYDGYNIKPFKHSSVDSNSLSDNFIISLYVDKKGLLWIGTYAGGLDMYDPVTEKFKHYNGDDKNSLSGIIIKSFLEDQEGTLWLGTNSGLKSFDRSSGKFKKYINLGDISENASTYKIQCIYEDKKNILWLGTFGGGLIAFNKKTNQFKYFSSPAKNGILIQKNSNIIRNICEDHVGVLWIATDGGVGLFDPLSEKYVKFMVHDDKDDNSLNHNTIVSLNEDKNNSMWIGTSGGGLNQYKNGKFIHHTSDEKDPNSINDNTINCTYIDRAGVIWIGTNFNGINAYFGVTNKFKHYKKQINSLNTLKSNIIFSLLLDKEELLWIGTQKGGLSSLNRKTGQYQHYDELMKGVGNNSAISLFEDNDGLIWVGTWGGGVRSYDKQTKEIKFYDKDEKLSKSVVMCIEQDKQGVIWMGTFGNGLFAYDKKYKKVINYTSIDGLSNNTVFSLHEDTKGVLWIGTDNGINTRDEATGKYNIYQHSTNKNSISSNTVYAIKEDKEGNIWIGTNGGLNKFNVANNQFSNYFEKNGLPSDNIIGLLIDKNERLWISTNKGISKFTPNMKNNVGNAFKNFDVSDGLQDLEFNQGAYFESNNGEMFFGGIHGFNSFSPNNIIDNPHVPPVYISSYKLFGKEIKLDTNITLKNYIELSYKENFLSFDFVALDYSFPSKNKYSYKLEGLDEDWSLPDNRRYANYPNLKGGDYVFRVRASNGDGVWNTEGSRLYIKIIPPFWETKWFYILSGLLGIGSVFGFIQYRTNKVEKEKKILETKVAERTLELAEVNKDITSSIRYAKRIQEAILPAQPLIFKHFTDAFILYRPKDIVSGDFYWFGEKHEKKIIAAVDCTGHGVPGAFMSMIGHNILNQVVIEKGIVEPGEILTQLHHGVQSALKQGTNITIDTSDGMDIAICSFDLEKKELQYAGAFRPLFIINKHGFQKLDANKFPIGGSQLDHERIFTSHTLQLEKGDSIYIFSDGYADQFGGANGKKFMVKQFKDLLIASQGQSMHEQGRILDNAMLEWRGEFQQVDDVLVIGIRI